MINNTQEASDATNMITGTAGKSDVPVVDVSEQMPADATTLNAWINQLINTIIDAVDPTYGCDAGTGDNTEGDASGENSSDTAANQSDSASDSANFGTDNSTTDTEGTTPSNEGQTDPGK